MKATILDGHIFIEKGFQVVYRGYFGSQENAVLVARHLCGDAAATSAVEKMKKSFRVVERPHRGYYKSFGSPHAADEYITTQEEVSHIVERPLVDYLPRLGEKSLAALKAAL